jgi:signal transduction histidine kinase
MSKIFESFYTTKSNGVRMALSNCRSTVENHGRRGWTSPNDGPGTSFHFALFQHHGDADGGVAGS